MGRKSIQILLKATSPEGETKTITSISEAAKELGFSKRGVGKAFHEKRNRIGEYELEWFQYEIPRPGVSLVKAWEINLVFNLVLAWKFRQIE